MSFNNTKTPLKPTDQSKVIYPLPKRANAQSRVTEYYLTPELEAKLRELFPVTMNHQLMEWFGMSHSTLHRFARELGLTKNREVILKKHAMQIKAICRRNGYYKSIKGKKPSQQCIEATKKKWAEGFRPIIRLKEISPRRYKALCRRMSEERKALIEREKRRYSLTLMQLSNLPTHLYSGDRYSNTDRFIRYYAKQKGYILGSIDPDAGERHVIYYTDQMIRLPRFERSATLKGWEFRNISSRGVILTKYLE